MRSYYYRILMPDRQVKSGFLRLAVERDFSARLWLERRFDAIVLSLVNLPGWLSTAQDFLSVFSNSGIRREHLSGFLRDMSLMASSGIPMLDALRSLEHEGESGDQPGFSAIARLILEELDSGASVSMAFSAHPDIFPETVCNLIKIGDATGSMDRMLKEAAEHVERISNIMRDTRTALIYPAFVFITILGVALFWVYYVVPNMAQLFKQMHAKLPPITVGLVAVAEWLTKNGPLFFAALILGVVLIWLWIKRSTRLRQRLYQIGHRLPIIRVLLRSAGLANITEHLALLTRSGMDVVGSLNVLERSTTDEYYRMRIQGMIAMVERGEGIAVAMGKVGGFPSMVVRMISVGEESGSLDSQLKHLAGEYRQRLDTVVKSLGEIIKPAVILVAGGVFMLLIISLLLPIYDLIKQVATSPMAGS